MKLKKFALRGLIIVAVCVALCMFFSGTIESITTPKVKIVKANRGKLTQNVELSATVVYPDTQDVSMRLPAGQTLTITRVNVRPGYEVEEGDVVLEAELTGYDSAREQAQASYDAALDELMALKRRYGTMTLRPTEESYARAYANLRSSIRAAADAETEMNLLLRSRNLRYSETGYPEGADEELCAAVDAYREARDLQAAAQLEFDQVSRRGIDENVWNYISESQTVQEKLEACSAAIVELEEYSRAAEAICAPHDGYISAVQLQAGAIYDGSAALYTITSEGSAPVLRADLEGVEQSVTEGMKVEFSSAKRGGISTKIASIGVNENGGKYADIELTKKMISAQGSLHSMTSSAQKITMAFKAAESTSLLPSSAVRGSGEDRFVYIVNEGSSGLGKIKKTIAKLPVTLIGESEGVASVSEDISYYQIAYMEDRPLNEGSAVMEYAS